MDKLQLPGPGASQDDAENGMKDTETAKDPQPIDVIRELPHETGVVEAKDALLEAIDLLPADADEMTKAVFVIQAENELQGRMVDNPAKLVKAALREWGRRDGKQPQTPAAWPEAVDGRELYDEIVEALDRFMAMRASQVKTVALWVMHTPIFDARTVTPYLAVTSPIKGCGKSRLLSIIKAMVPRPLLVSNATPAAIFRGIAEKSPTLLLDECDTFLGQSKELQGVLHSGNMTGGHIQRCDNAGPGTIEFKTHCPKVMGAIGKLPAALQDRSINIWLHKKKRSEKVDSLNRYELAALEKLAARIVRWGEDHRREQETADPDLPKEVDSRNADKWEPLISIAELIDGEIAKATREIAVEMVCSEDSDSREIRLLGDLQALFNSDPDAERMSSAEIVKRLQEMEERPWGEPGQNGQLTDCKLAALLKSFGIKSKCLRFGSRTLRGYEVAEFSDTFERYLGDSSS